MALSKEEQQELAQLQAEQLEDLKADQAAEEEAKKYNEEMLAAAEQFQTGKMPELPSETAEVPSPGLLDYLDVTGAPARQALLVGARKGIIPEALKAIGPAMADPRMAITGEEQMAYLGVPTTRAKQPEPISGLGPEIDVGIPVDVRPETSPAALAGAAYDIGADILQPAIGTGRALVRGASKVLGPVIGGAAKLAGIGASKGIAAAGETAGAALGDILSGAPTAGRTAEAALTQAGQAIGKLPESVVGYLSGFVPKVRPELEAQLKLGQKYGVDPGLLSKSRELLYGPNQLVTNVNAAERQVLGGKSREVLLKSQEQVQNALGTIQTGLAKGVDYINPEETGRIMRESYDRVIDDLFKRNDVRYSTIAKEIGDKPLTPEAAKSIQESTDKLLFRFQQIAEDADRQIKLSTKSSVRAQAEANRDAVNRIIDGLQGQDIAGTIQQMQELGRDAFGKQRFFGVEGKLDPDPRLLKQLYGDMRDVVVTNLRAVNPEAAAKLEAANKEMSDFFSQNRFIGRIMQDEKVSPEKAFENLVLQGKSNELDALVKILGKDEEAMGAMRGMFLEAIQKKTADKDTIPVSSLKALYDQKNQRIVSRLFQPGELDDFEGMLKIARDLGDVNWNTSKTAVLEKATDLRSIIKAYGAKQASDVLEAKALQDKLTQASVGDLIALKQAGMYDPAVLDLVIAQKKADPGIMGSMKRMSSVDKMTSDISSAAEKVALEASPQEKFDAVLNYLGSVSKEFGSNFVPFAKKPDQVSRTMQILGELGRKNPEADRPVAIPPDYVEDTKIWIQQQPISPLDKARNIFNLEQAGIVVSPAKMVGKRPFPAQPLPGMKTITPGLSEALRDVIRARPSPEVETERPKR